MFVDVALEAKDDGDIASESLKRAVLSLLLLLLLLLWRTLFILEL